jgi:DNA primase
MDASQFRGEVVFTFDGDAAGQRAALRAFSMEERFVTQTFVAVQPDGLDPCDLRVKQGDAAVRDLIAQRVPLFEFAIRSALGGHNLDTAEGRLAALDAAAPIVGRIKDRGLRQLYAVNLDRWIGMMDEQFVLDRVRAHSGPIADVSGRTRGGSAGGASGRGPAGNGRSAAHSGQYAQPGRYEQPGQHAQPGRYQDPGRPRAGQPGAAAGDGRGSQQGPRAGGSGQAAGPAPSGAETRRVAPYDEDDPVVNVERQALKLAAQRPALCGPAFDELGADAFTMPAHVAARALIAACGGVAAVRSAREWAEQLRSAAPDDSARSFITRLIVEPVEAPGIAGEPDARYAEAVLARVEELAVSREIAQIKRRLQRLNPVSEQGEYNRLFGDLVALEQRRKVLADRASGAL